MQFELQLLSTDGVLQKEVDRWGFRNQENLIFTIVVHTLDGSVVDAWEFQMSVLRA